MLEAIDSHQTSGESCSPKAPTEPGRSFDCLGRSSGKSKKRERPDQNTTAVKKVQLMEECTSPRKLEFTENIVDDGGGLASIAAVDQLLSHMKEWKSSSSLQKSAVAKILSATSKDDCLKKFVLLGGVSILEEWIQEVSKIRSADSAVKESDKVLDEEIMVILQALEKLPISLETLKGCSIGKSVKQLRSVRNGEIQKKARKLVDTWRKKVYLEMENGLQPAAVVDRLQQAEAAAYAADTCTNKSTDSRVAAKSGVLLSQEDSSLVKLETPPSTPTNGAPLDGSPEERLKTSPEKSVGKKPARPSSSSLASATGLNSAKKQKLSSSLVMDKDHKDEGLNSPDFQDSKEKDMKGESSSNHPTTDMSARKTNEYRKKLRSGGSSAPPCSTESNAVGLPSNAGQSRDGYLEKVRHSESNVGDSEQPHIELPNCHPDAEFAGGQAADEISDRPFESSKDTVKKDGHSSRLHLQDGKVEIMNESCLSSQSSCSDKRNSRGHNGLNAEKKSLLTSLSQDDTKPPPVTSIFSEQANDSYSGKEDAVQATSRSLSSEINHQGAFSHKSTYVAEPRILNDTVVNVLSEKHGSTYLTNGVDGGATDLEESCCSHNTKLYRNVVDAAPITERSENVEQIAAKHSPMQDALHGSVGTRDGVTSFESTKFVASNCQDMANETSNPSQTSLLATNEDKISNGSGEIDNRHTVRVEIPAFSQSCHDFDLNEGLAMDEFGHDIQPSCCQPSNNSSLLPKSTCTLSAPIAVSAASKGAFIPPLNVPNKSDIGWRGSAATSAFRPAEPRHTQVRMPAPAPMEVKNVNNFDLNIADHELLEDPPLRQSLAEGHFDLNYGGKVNQITASVPDSSKQAHVFSSGNCTEKRAVLDFDLNEQLDEVPQEQEICHSFAAKNHDDINVYGALSGHSTCNYNMWNSGDCSSYPGSAAAIGPRIELFCPCPASQPVGSSRQVTSTAFVPPPPTSFVFSQPAPFFGGSQQNSFPATFTYNPMSVGPDTSFVVSKGFPETSFLVSKSMPGAAGLPTHGRPRAEMSVRPAFLANIDDLSGGNNYFAWGTSPQNIYGNPGATIISYNDVPVVGREHVVNVDGTGSLGEQMRIFQQPVVPVSSLKRRDPEYFPGLKQTTWH